MVSVRSINTWAYMCTTQKWVGYLLGTESLLLKIANVNITLVFKGIVKNVEALLKIVTG